MNQQASRAHPGGKVAHIESAVDDLTGAASSLLKTQTDLAKTLVRRCAGDPRADPTTIGQQTLNGMTSSFEKLIDGWFGWLQLTDALTGSRYWPNPPGSTIYLHKDVTVPAANIPAVIQIVSSALDDGSGNRIDAGCIWLDPQLLQAATDQLVKVEIWAPLATVPGLYTGSINDAASGNVVFQYEIVV
jgi:hypothetical protein